MDSATKIFAFLLASMTIVGTVVFVIGAIVLAVKERYEQH